MSAIKMARLTLLNHIDMIGLRSFLVKAWILNFLNILLFATVFSTAFSGSFSLSQLSMQYVYFVPLTTFSSALGSWETELTHNLGEDYLLRGWAIFPSRIFIALAESMTALLFFAILLLMTGADLKHIITLGLMAFSFTALGSAVGFHFGFRHEKAVNNYLNAAIWVFGFGPGPFFGMHPNKFQLPFPGSSALIGHFSFEWLKLVLFLIVAIVLFRLSQKRKSYSLYRR